jgi:hypothetical protein
MHCAPSFLEIIAISMTWRTMGARPSVVVNVELQARGLTGDVPAELRALTALKLLRLGGNQLTAGAYTRPLSELKFSRF